MAGEQFNFFYAAPRALQPQAVEQADVCLDGLGYLAEADVLVGRVRARRASRRP